MMAVFGGFVLGDLRAIKLFGIGLASAIFLDAFLLRTILVPSIMHLLGKANWFYPKSLEKITPHVSIDAEDAAEARVPALTPRGDEDELASV
jgi:RND superfamily putative drug exporter